MTLNKSRRIILHENYSSLEIVCTLINTSPCENFAKHKLMCFIASCIAIMKCSNVVLHPNKGGCLLALLLNHLKFYILFSVTPCWAFFKLSCLMRIGYGYRIPSIYNTEGYNFVQMVVLFFCLIIGINLKSRKIK